MSNPDVSVIVVTYNQRVTIARALESILCRLPGNVSCEIVIGDDGSTDGTREICNEYADRSPDVIRLLPKAPNKGIVENYRDAFMACRGRYITDCAGDDAWIGSGRMESQLHCLDSHPEVVIVHGDWVEVTADGECTARRKPYGMDGEPVVTDGRDLLEPLLAHRSPIALHLSTAMYRRSTLLEALRQNPDIVFDPEFGCEDLPLTAALLARGKVAYIPGEVLAYTVGHPSVSNPQNMTKSLHYFKATVKCTFALARFYGIKSKALDRYFAEKKLYMAKLALKCGQPVEALRIICARRWG